MLILNWNGKIDTLACLSSLSGVAYPFTILVVDNGSTDDSIQAISTQFPHITLIATQENLGFAEGNNVGIRYALEKGADFVFLLNNDTVVDPAIFAAFERAMIEDPSVGIWGAKNCLFNSPDTLDHLGGIWNRKKGNFDLVGYREEEAKWVSAPELDYVCGCSLLIKAQVIHTIGLLEPRFFLIWEEADWCYRAKKAGFKIKSCLNAKIWHKVSASFSGKPHTTYFWWRNRLLWIERNCTKKEYCYLALTQIIPQVFKLLKLFGLKAFQNLIQTKEKRLNEQQRYYAALRGIKDYLTRRFGNAPQMVLKPLSKKSS